MGSSRDSPVSSVSRHDGAREFNLLPHRPSSAAWALSCALTLSATLFLSVSTTTAAPRLEDAPSAAGVLTLLDYFQAGRERAERFVKGRSLETGLDLDAVLRRVRGACVRIEVRYNQQDGAYQAYTATGVLVDGGRHVLTAGHVVPPGEVQGQEVHLTLSDGRSFAAQRLGGQYEVFATGDEDWALLEVLGAEGAALPSVQRGTPHDGGFAYVLGYPSDLGIEPGGRIEPGLAHSKAPLDPLLFVGRVNAQGPVDLEPVAGCIPLGGASGAPVVDEQGRLLGVFVSVSQAQKAGSLEHRYQVARAEVLAPVAGLVGRSGT